MTGWLIAFFVLLVINLAVLTAAFFMIARGVGKLSNDMSGFLNETKTELVPAIKELRQVLNEADNLTSEIKEKVQRLDGVISNVERVADGRFLATTAAKVFEGSRITAASVVEGVRQGLRTFRGVGKTQREANQNESE